jgi:alkanesulfonate monooxygenase SsuD/methylene tetrahydromethanopterin reductase-like flavin-dependent oxidoreductase (luciferase family)
MPDPRAATNPLFNDNRFKLGTFGMNVSNGCAISSADGVFETTWPNVLRLARMADRAGFEALVPVARWRGFGGETNFNGRCFETYTWAAGLAQATRHSAVFATSHVPTVHPLVAAKQATTIDHISNGRFALNIVCGWFEPEMEMFGAPIMEHEVRYDYAAEWIGIVKRLWTEQAEWSAQGRFFNIANAFHQPKPVQRPYPALMNAGGSETGRHYTAKHCDMAFVHVTGHDPATAGREAARVRDLARNEYGRDIQVWTNCYCVIADSDAEAKKLLDHIVREKGDWVAVDNIARSLGVQTGILPKEAIEGFKYHFIAGWGGYPLVGTAETVAREIGRLADAGVAGAVMSWPRYEEGLGRFIAEVMPHLERQGLRAPFVPAAVAAE